MKLVKYGKVNRLVVNWIKKKLVDYEEIYYDKNLFCAPCTA